MYRSFPILRLFFRKHARGESPPPTGPPRSAKDDPSLCALPVSLKGSGVGRDSPPLHDREDSYATDETRPLQQTRCCGKQFQQISTGLEPEPTPIGQGELETKTSPSCCINKGSVEDPHLTQSGCKCLDIRGMCSRDEIQSFTDNF